MRKEEILRFVEPIMGFCVKRLANRADAEDLASDIMLHALDGMARYDIEQPDAWVWRIAHNRYARLIQERQRQDQARFKATQGAQDDMDFIDELQVKEEHAEAFRALHSLANEYRNILVDYYIHEMSVKGLCEKYALPESTVKWRLNIGRQRIKKRLGAICVDKVYQRINWNTDTCNGNVDVERYLHTQIARAICQAAYEKPASVEEISDRTGIPAMYIEDELPRLIGGDAVSAAGGKYGADFIVLRQGDIKALEASFLPLAEGIAARMQAMMEERRDAVAKLPFYGADFGLARLGHIIVPAVLRARVNNIMKQTSGLSVGPYPPRKDGGYGWFVVQEAPDADERMPPYASGCNSSGLGRKHGFVYYYWIGRYFDEALWNDGGIRWLTAQGLPRRAEDGLIPERLLTQEELIRLVKNNLVVKSGAGYKLNFACFSQEAFARFAELFTGTDEAVEEPLRRLIDGVHAQFKAFVPKRLDGQINQYVRGYVQSIVGYVLQRLVDEGLLASPEDGKPLTDGVFYIDGPYAAP